MASAGTIGGRDEHACEGDKAESLRFQGADMFPMRQRVSGLKRGLAHPWDIDMHAGAGAAGRRWRAHIDVRQVARPKGDI